MEQFKNYVKKPQPVKAKLWQPGDEDGFVTTNVGGKAPYVRLFGGGKTVAEFGTQYLVVDADYRTTLIPTKTFEQDYELIDQ